MVPRHEALYGRPGLYCVIVQLAAGKRHVCPLALGLRTHAHALVKLSPAQCSRARPQSVPVAVLALVPVMACAQTMALRRSVTVSFV